ncbi:MAG: hypothetical protein O6848_00635 [Bacteroidetes bacterium]|nr:hypothetical protein [Bacteroidota bacterium]
MNRLKATILSLITIILTQTYALSQVREKIEMADKFRADGKIYVVLAIILVILAGLFFYLIRIDRKVTKLEEQKQD